MSIFSQGKINEPEEIIEVRDVTVDSIPYLICEAYERYTEILESFHAIDFSEIELNKKLNELTEESTDQAIIESAVSEYDVVMEASFKDVLDKIIKWFNDAKAFFGKILDSIVKFLYSKFAPGKAFATKYESALMGLKDKLKDYKKERYSFKQLKGETESPEVKLNELKKEIDAIMPNEDLASISLENAKKYTEQIREKKESIEDSFRSKFVGGEGKASTFDRDLYAHFRGEKGNYYVDIKEAIDVLKSDKFVEDAKHARKVSDSIFNAKINELKSVQSKVKENKESEKGLREARMALVQALLSVFVTCNSIMLKYIRSWQYAVNEYHKEMGEACKGAFAHARQLEKGKPEAKKEEKKEEPKEEKPEEGK